MQMRLQMRRQRVSHWEPRGPELLLRVLRALQVLLLRERVRVLPQALERVLPEQRAQQVLGRELRVQPEP